MSAGVDARTTAGLETGGTKTPGNFAAFSGILRGFPAISDDFRRFPAFSGDPRWLKYTVSYFVLMIYSSARPPI